MPKCTSDRLQSKLQLLHFRLLAHLTLNVRQFPNRPLGSVNKSKLHYIVKMASKRVHCDLTNLFMMKYFGETRENE